MSDTSVALRTVRCVRYVALDEDHALHTLHDITYSRPILQGAAEKSGPLNFFAVFSATVWDFNTKILQLYLLKPFTSNSQVKCDSVEKRRSYRFFNITAYRFFGI